MKRTIFLLLVMLLAWAATGAERPRPGEIVDLAPFGHANNWDGNPGVEWDEPRDIRQVEIDFSNLPELPARDALKLEYWVSNWPPLPGGGWTKTDTPWQGEWRSIEASPEIVGKSFVYRFPPLTEMENPNARNVPGYSPAFRRTLKFRVRFSRQPLAYAALRIYGGARWNVREINLQSGLEGMAKVKISATAYNGWVLGSEPFDSSPPGMRLKVLYTEHEPLSNDRTILTLQGASHAFAVSVDDVIERKGVYVKPFGVFLGDAAVGMDFSSYVESGRILVGEDILSRISRQPEQTLTRALGEIPRLAFSARSSHPHHPYRYIPLGFPASREKYALDFTGNVFISKKGVKAMKEDLARMLWEGDEIEFRLGTGKGPDFREREGGATQSLEDGYLPPVTTEWQSDGLVFQEEAYATLLDAHLDDTRLRGDEPSVLFLNLRVRNPRPEPAQASVWFHVRPAERLELRTGMLLGTGSAFGAYAHPRLRAVLEPSEGRLRIDTLSLGAAYEGSAAAWSVALPGQGEATLVIKIPFRTFESSSDMERVRRLGYVTRRNETLSYWRRVLAGGMEIQVPDDELNRFYHAALQHIFMSVQRDVKTGYDMCPCGTYDYNMFANETAMQVRLLDMRGRHDWAWRCLRPIVELQGSKPLPGNFRDKSAIFHGVRVDDEHDYTNSGYNLNHGWILWTLSEHYLFTRDQEWLRSVVPRILKASDWIIRERQATMQRGPDGMPVSEYGLLPAGQLEDNEDFEYWFAVNAYAYHGLRTAAEATSAIDPANGERLKKEAEAYRADIRQAVLRAMSISPAVPLRDGTFIPSIPSRTSLHGRDFGWIRNVLYGAHVLLDCGVFNVDEPLATWILQDYEDNLFMAEDSMSVPDRDWFSRGGVALQPNLVNTFVSYLERDRLPPAARAFYNDFAISYYPDVSAFTEWVPTLGTGGGPFFKTSDEAGFLAWLRLMLVREEREKLYLNSGCPRHWFLPGGFIEVKQAATFFGTVSFRVEAHPEQNFVEARISPPQRQRPKELSIRLRHPEGNKIVRVEVDGRPWTNFNAAAEQVSLPTGEHEVRVRAYFK